MNRDQILTIIKRVDRQELKPEQACELIQEIISKQSGRYEPNYMQDIRC